MKEQEILIRMYSDIIEAKHSLDANKIDHSLNWILIILEEILNE